MDPLVAALVEALGGDGLCNDMHLLSKHEHFNRGRPAASPGEKVFLSKAPLGVLLL